ncbi:hypothetical protein BJ138DRAFT_1020037, partial [Hygrophoropsis aurantiaca]
MWCKTCIVKTHTFLPFHKVESWNGLYFQPTALFDVGFVWHLGHGGKVCPNSDLASWEDIPNDGGLDDEEKIEVDEGNWKGGHTTVMRFIHSSGIFTHRVSWCCCDSSARRDLQLFKARLFPSSFAQPQTAFTFEVLDHFWIDAIECKTSAMAFYEKIRRLTSANFPHKLPDRYRELMRMSRIWRDLNNRVRFGYGHETQSGPGPGDLALFCPACPQPKVNLPEDWAEKYNSWLVKARLVTDGNFSAQHMKMKNPEDDVSLTDGEGYMTTEGPYAEHISTAVESKQKSYCNNHRAVNAALCNRVNLRATAVGAVACAR